MIGMQGVAYVMIQDASDGSCGAGLVLSLAKPGLETASMRIAQGVLQTIQVNPQAGPPSYAAYGTPEQPAKYADNSAATQQANTNAIIAGQNYRMQVQNGIYLQQRTTAASLNASYYRQQAIKAGVFSTATHPF